jgi:hypothetical protein
MPPIKLLTKERWDQLSPRTQGYNYYMQASLPGSELRDAVCPYPQGSKKAREYAAGEFTAMLDVQDGED